MDILVFDERRHRGKGGAYSGLSFPVQKTSPRTGGYGDQLVWNWDEGVGGQQCHGRAVSEPWWYGCRVLEGIGAELRSCLSSLNSSGLFESLFLHSPASPLIIPSESSRESTECFLEPKNVHQGGAGQTFRDFLSVLACLQWL